MVAPADRRHQVLRRVSEAGSTISQASWQRLRDSLSDGFDRALATDIAVGVMRWRAALDTLITRAAKRPTDRLDRVLDILRIYQLLHLARVPASAVVDDAVNLTKAGKKSASGLVNAIAAQHLAAAEFPRPSRRAPRGGGMVEMQPSVP